MRNEKAVLAFRKLLLLSDSFAKEANTIYRSKDNQADINEFELTSAAQSVIKSGVYFQAAQIVARTFDLDPKAEQLAWIKDMTGNGEEPTTVSI